MAVANVNLSLPLSPVNNATFRAKRPVLNSQMTNSKFMDIFPNGHYFSQLEWGHSLCITWRSSALYKESTTKAFRGGNQIKR
jgi:hypothetical protein